MMRRDEALTPQVPRESTEALASSELQVPLSQSARLELHR